MLRPRIIPCLLVHKGGLVKTKVFDETYYVGDPINAVKIFNEKETDEIMVLDIDATVQGREPDFGLIEKLASECRMPLCYGGGIKTASQATRIVEMGVEKIAVSSAAVVNPRFLSEMAAAIGRQSVVAVLDVRRKDGIFNRGLELLTHNAKNIHRQDPLQLAEEFEAAGAGEIVVNCVDRDGMMLGYDLDLAQRFRERVNLPLTILGGAGSLYDLGQLFAKVGVVGAAAGSLFVFKGKYRAVLINYPTPLQKSQICRESLINFKNGKLNVR